MRGRACTLQDAPRGARLIICGGRFYGRLHDAYATEWKRRQDTRRVAAQRQALFEALDLLAPREIAHGAAPGADSLADEWAASRRVPQKRFPKGARSGFLRNRRMFDEFKPDGTVAFPGGNGTADMGRVTLDGGAWLVRIR